MSVFSHPMCKYKKPFHPSSLASVTVSFFKSSLLCISLVSTFYAHSSFSLPFFSVLVFFSFLFSNVIFMFKKMRRHERLVPAKKQHDDENKVLELQGLQNEDDNWHDESQIRSCCGEKENDKNIFKYNLISCTNYSVHEKNEIDLGKFELSPLSSSGISNLNSNSSLYDEKSILGDTDEDYIIEITLPEVSQEERKRHELLEPALLHKEGLEDFLSDIDEITSGEDNLIEIDISMGSIRHASREIGIA